MNTYTFKDCQANLLPGGPFDCTHSSCIGEEICLGLVLDCDQSSIIPSILMYGPSASSTGFKVVITGLCIEAEDDTCT